MSIQQQDPQLTQQSGQYGPVAVEIHAVSKVFREQGFSFPWSKKGKEKEAVHAVDNVTLQVQRKEIVGILGANGSGKSTLIRMISTLLLPDTGHIHIFGYDVVKDERKVQHLINRVSVEASFFKKLSPLENLMYAARLYNMDGTEARIKAFSILERLRIPRDRIRKPLEDMSRGMQQKVAIARAFLTSPIILLLDEPTTGLDPRSKLDVQEFVLELRRDHDATILITTHDMDEAEELCDRVAVIDKGKITALGQATELKEQVGSLQELGRAATMNEVFMHFTAAKQITEEDIRRYGSWEKAFEALEHSEKEQA